MIGSIIFVVLSMVICVAFCVLRASKATFYSLTLKILASLCFIFAGILALTVVGWGTVGIMIIVGMVFGLIGDIVLDLKIMYPEKNDTYFLIGTGSFAVGHVFYFIAGLLTMLDSGNAIALSWAIPVALVLAGVLTLGIMLSSKKWAWILARLNGQLFRIALCCRLCSSSLALWQSLTLCFGFLLLVCLCSYFPTLCFPCNTLAEKTKRFSSTSTTYFTILLNVCLHYSCCLGFNYENKTRTRR